jgi:hypothetical protein
MAEGAPWVGVYVASRRVAQCGSSRTVFRKGNVVRPGDTKHTDSSDNASSRAAVPEGPGNSKLGPILDEGFVSEINSGGNAIVRRVTVRVGDDGCDPAQYLASRAFLVIFCG